MLSRLTLAAALSLVVVLSTVLAGTTTAAAQSPAVVSLFERGLAAYREGRFEEAASLFEEAHAIEPIADLTYNRARALENLGRLEDAAAAYRLFLEESPDTADRRGIEERIRALEARVAEARRLEEERARLEAERARLEEERARTIIDPRATRESAGAWPWALAGLGAAGLAAGAVTGALALDAHDRAASRDIAQPESVRLEGDANDLAIATDVLLIAGGAIAAAGIVWGVVDLASGGEAEPSVTATILPGGVAVRATF